KAVLDLWRLVLDPVLQAAITTGVVNRRNLFEPGFHHLAVFPADGGSEQVVSNAQQSESRQGKDEGVPEAEAQANVPAQPFKAEEHNQLLSACGSFPDLYQPCCATGERAHQRHWSVDRSCNRKYARGSWSW